jgi:hypothetical protein
MIGKALFSILSPIVEPESTDKKRSKKLLDGKRSAPLVA